jgi:hypothetical protein
MAAPWRALERMVDDLVDDQWGEDVEIHPWTGAGIEDSGGPDASRRAIVTIGILVMPGAAAVGEGGTVSTGMASAPLGASTWLSISTHNLKGIALNDLQEGDRVYFPDRDEWYMIDHPLPSVTARPQVYLNRLERGSME